MSGFLEAVRTTLAEIWAHKLRSALTLIGVVLGTAAVVINVTIIEGIKVMVWDGIRGLGFDGVMFVFARAPETFLERQKTVFSNGMAVQDVGVLTQGGETLEAVAALRQADMVVRVGGEQRKIRVMGVTPSYGKVHDREVSAGRWFDAGDESDWRRVAVVGHDLAGDLFGSENPLGRTLRIGDEVFKVIGVEAQIGNRFANSGWGRREMKSVLVPLATFQTYLKGGDSVNVVTVKTRDTEHLAVVKGEVERLMRRAHRGVGDFRVENVADEILKAEKQVRVELNNWTVVLAAIAGISLLVGGVGIYSVLKISLAERLFEIGLRKAIGACDRAILVQFMVESTTLSVLGAALGCLLGAGVARAASGVFEAGLPLAPLGLLLGIGFAVSVGLFAGVFPALSAARLTPVEALRG